MSGGGQDLLRGQALDDLLATDRQLDNSPARSQVIFFLKLPHMLVLICQNYEIFMFNIKHYVKYQYSINIKISNRCSVEDSYFF